jgi:prevent-host-death family protein
MATRVGARELKTHLSDYLNRATCRGERFLVERHGKSAAALVSVEDLRRLEAWDAGARDTDLARQAAFRRALEEAGVVVQWPSGPPVSPDERAPLEVPGPPISEQIIADRR